MVMVMVIIIQQVAVVCCSYSGGLYQLQASHANLLPVRTVMMMMMMMRRRLINVVHDDCIDND